MFKNVTIVFLGILLFFVMGCNIKTPEIRGVVLDAETKQPVEGAWVTATLEVYNKTVAGDVHQSLFVGKTWTDKEGKFLLPSKEFKKPSFPVSFGSKVESLNIGARAINSKGYISEGIGLKEFKEVSEIKLFLKPPKDAEYYFLALQTLYSYISTGRVGISVPLVSEAERSEVLNMTIGAYEKFLQKYSEEDLEKFKKYEEKRGGYITANYGTALEQLAYLFKKKGDYNKSLETFKKVKAFDEKHSIKLNIKDYEYQINELQQLLQKQK